MRKKNKSQEKVLPLKDSPNYPLGLLTEKFPKLKLLNNLKLSQLRLNKKRHKKMKKKNNQKSRKQPLQNLKKKIKNSHKKKRKVKKK